MWFQAPGSELGPRNSPVQWWQVRRPLLLLTRKNCEACSDEAKSHACRVLLKTKKDNETLGLLCYVERAEPLAASRSFFKTSIMLKSAQVASTVSSPRAEPSFSRSSRTSVTAGSLPASGRMLPARSRSLRPEIRFTVPDERAFIPFVRTVSEIDRARAAGSHCLSQGPKGSW